MTICGPWFGLVGVPSVSFCWELPIKLWFFDCFFHMFWTWFRTCPSWTLCSIVCFLIILKDLSLEEFLSNTGGGDLLLWEHRHVFLWAWGGTLSFFETSAFRLTLDPLQKKCEDALCWLKTMVHRSVTQHPYYTYIPKAQLMTFFSKNTMSVSAEVNWIGQSADLSDDLKSQLFFFSATARDPDDLVVPKVQSDAPTVLKSFSGFSTQLPCFQKPMNRSSSFQNDFLVALKPSRGCISPGPAFHLKQ